ncbi:hypothetical protein RvY_09938-2 [Ramazzottius varieornatus]|uniref:Homeobox domain-containing protein n=1 Tax=Ramazzottius varieornatus TaxID=947166 RepID=A0A1D1VD74_RAMVA|nr:hypothetical protein RvY_09938-2 [Ramazzottius varieornatus]
MALQSMEYDRSSSPLSSISGQSSMNVKEEESCSEHSLQSPPLSPANPQSPCKDEPEPRNLSKEPSRKRPSFLIDDILSKDYSSNKPSQRIVRPWDLPPSASQSILSEKFSRSKAEKSLSKCQKGSPLDALLKLANKTFEGLEKGDGRLGTTSPTTNSSHGTSGNSKKKRKSRTAFTNHQVFELEKRFIYQKYLSPADRDEIAQSLGLTNAQVITWYVGAQGGCYSVIYATLDFL